MDGTTVAMDPPAIWAEVSSSPVALTAPPDNVLAREALLRCGQGDEGLRAAADEALHRALQGLPLPDSEALAFAQRAAGEPHPWARAWSASAKSLPLDATLHKLDAWLSEDPLRWLRRCAVATGVARDGTRALVVVAVDALADLGPLPTRARTGQWLTLDAHLRVHAAAGTVLVLGPGGAPRRVPAWFDGSTLRARFALDRPGEFTVQVLATTTGGPRPVVEATIFADLAPPLRESAEPTPGEDAADTTRSDDDALAVMLAAARMASGEPALARDARLDVVARDHARRMAAAHALAHDTGDGDPSERLQAAGLLAQSVGENVAHAPNVTLAHRSLWASPSHRANMLRRDFERVGVAVERDERGEVWIVETFASDLR